MQYQPQASLSDRKLQYMSLLEGFTGLSGKSHEELKRLISSNESIGNQMDEWVVFKASQQNIDGDTLTGILVAGPPTDNMIDQKVPIGVVRDELINLTKGYYQQQIDKQIQSLPQQNFVAKSAKSTIVAGYSVLKATESAVFSVTPLPLAFTKSVIQKVATPLFIAAVASRLPAVGAAIGTATHLGGSLTSTAFSVISGSALAQFGNFALSTLPNSVSNALTAQLPNSPWMGALAGQSISGITNVASTSIVVGSANRLGQALGSAGTAVLIGNTAMTVGAAIAQKGIGVVLADTKRSALSLGQKTQAIIAKTQRFIQSTQQKLGLNMSNESRNEPQSGLSSAQRQYMELVQAHPETKGRTYDELGEAYARSVSGEKFSQDAFVAEAANTQGKTAQEIREIIAASPHVKASLEAVGVLPEAIHNYLDEVEGKYSLPPSDKTPSIEQINTEVGQAQSESSETVMSAQDTAINSGIMATLGTTFGIEKLKNAQINYNGEEFFRLQNYNRTKAVDSPESRYAADMFQKALSDPSNVKGDIKISIGGQLLVHVVDGKVELGHQFIKDTSMKAEVSTPEKAAYDKLSAPIQASGFSKTQQTAVAAFNAGYAREEVVDILKNDPSYQKYVDRDPQTITRMLDQTEAMFSAREERSPEKQQTQTPAREKEAAIVV
jgi:hypothetical protein